MANEIKIPCEFWPHPTRDANAYMDTLALTNNEFVDFGAILPDTVLSRICFKASEPLPTNYASAPKLRISWKTASTDTTSAWQAGYEIDAFTPDTDTEDPTSWGLDSTATDISAGAGKVNTLEIDISSLTEAAGDVIKGTISRDAQVTNASDTLASSVQIVALHIIGST